MFSLVSVTEVASLLSIKVRSPVTYVSSSAATVSPSCSLKYMFPDTFLRAARLAFLTWRSPVVCVIALRSHCIAPGASHFTPAAVVSFGNVADASWVLVERTSSSKVSSPLAVYPPVPANPVSSGKDSAVRAVFALMLIDAAVMRSGVVRVVTVVVDIHRYPVRVLTPVRSKDVACVSAGRMMFTPSSLPLPSTETPHGLPSLCLRSDTPHAAESAGHLQSMASTAMGANVRATNAMNATPVTARGGDDRAMRARSTGDTCLTRITKHALKNQSWAMNSYK